MTRPDIKWFPGIGQLEEWRMDIQSRITTASGLSSLQVGDWVTRPFEQGCTFEELGTDRRRGRKRGAGTQAGQGGQNPQSGKRHQTDETNPHANVQCHGCQKYDHYKSQCPNGGGQGGKGGKGGLTLDVSNIHTVAEPAPEPETELGVLDTGGFFYFADEDDDGFVTKSEFTAYCHSQQGCAPTPADWKEFYKCDENGDDRYPRKDLHHVPARDALQ